MREPVIGFSMWLFIMRVFSVAFAPLKMYVLSISF